MADKSGGDILQANSGAQGNMSSQDLNSIAAGGVGAVDAMGGAAAAMGAAGQSVTQGQMQGNMGIGGAGGSDNVNADTNINV